MAIVNAATISLADVTTAYNSTVDGDTLVIPPGTVEWTGQLAVTKFIKITGANTSKDDDQTVITDGNSASPLLKATLNSTDASKVFWLNGITFKQGSVARSLVFASKNAVVLTGKSAYATSGAYRISNCHFDKLHRFHLLIQGWLYGVTDHTKFDGEVGANEVIYLYHDTWVGADGGTPASGHGSWNDLPYFGTNKFMFFEDCTFNNLSGTNITGSGSLDGAGGMRVVVRYCNFNACSPGNHGTGSGANYRGGRVMEIYRNNWDFPFPSAILSQFRNGTAVYHDNVHTGQFTAGVPLLDYRQGHIYADFGGATGNNPWDVNATESDKTHIDGHPPYLFLSGTASSTTPFGNAKLIVDGATWTTDQWVGFSLTNTTTSRMSFITANTANTITTWAGGGQPVVWHAGDGFAIYKCLISMDQPGRGKGDLVTGGTPSTEVNSVTGTPSWPNEALEPGYSWGNTLNGAPFPNYFHSISPTLTEGVDYFNDTVMPGYSEYVYPHPLVSGSPAPVGKIIVLTGNMTFGGVIVNATAQLVLTISNTGDTLLTVSSITYPTGYTGAYSGTIAAGASHNVTVTFAPTLAQAYNGTITVNSDKTAGNNTASVTGTGTAPIQAGSPHPERERSGARKIVGMGRRL